MPPSGHFLELSRRNRHVGFTRRTGIAERKRGSDNPILLQKSFRGGERKFLEPLMRFMRGNVRDHIVSSKIDHEPPQWR
jgi:hypothetical protein